MTCPFGESYLEDVANGAYQPTGNSHNAAW